MKYIYTYSLLFSMAVSGVAFSANTVDENRLTTIATAENVNEAGPEDPVSLNVFPNPATTYIEVNCAAEIDEIVIFNTLGAVVHREKGSGTTARISVNDLPKGVYLLRCNGTTKRFVKK